MAVIVNGNLIPKEITKQQASFVYANEVDLLHVALFGVTAKEWHESKRSTNCLLTNGVYGQCEPISVLPWTEGFENNDTILPLCREQAIVDTWGWSWNVGTRRSWEYYRSPAI